MSSSDDGDDRCFISNGLIHMFEYEECSLKGDKYRGLVKSLSGPLKVSKLFFNPYGVEFEELEQGISPITLTKIVDHGKNDFEIYLKANNYVGYFTVDKYTFIILPKIFRKNIDRESMIISGISLLLYMIDKILLSSKNLLDKIRMRIMKETLYMIERYRQYNLLMELLGLQYVMVLYDELNRGVYREYTIVEGEENFLKGKLLLMKQIRKLPHQLTRFSVRYHRLSMNNQLNRVLYYAAYLVYHKSKLQGTVRRAKYIMELLSEAQTFRNPLLEGEPVFHRLNMRFYDAYVLAGMIIHGIGSWPKHRAHGFLVDMNMLFQYYIYSILKHSSLSKYFKIKAEDKIGYLLSGGRISQIPDIVLYQGDKPVFIIDVKYKELICPGSNDSSSYPYVDDLRQAYIYGKLASKVSKNHYRGTALVYITHKNNMDHDTCEYSFAIEENDHPLYMIGFNTYYYVKDPVNAEKSLVKIINDFIERRNK